ncbi:hypothetical protein, partial [Pseudomonas aeruginosa]|uniref:hypothetical protein n=1 Tax=Pseudomonas aeruginosa TaxID=287 RepID=UPI002575F557
LQVTRSATIAKQVALARNAPCLAHNKKPRTIAGPIGGMKLVFVARLIRALNATVSVERNGGLINILVVPVCDSAGAGRTAIPVNFSVDALHILPGHTGNHLSLHLGLA